MDRRSYLKSSFAVAGSLCFPVGALSLIGCNGINYDSTLSGFRGKIMGTGYSVLVSGQTEATFENLPAQVHAELHDIDVHMSTWRTESELSKFNNNESLNWQTMSPSTMQVIKRALDTHAISKGAFDVTVGALVDLWGFGPSGAISSGKPNTIDVKNLLSDIGSNLIEIDINKNVVRKRNPNVRLDLSGIAKGYGVDRVASLLDALGIENYLVEVGGELRSCGLKSNGAPWRVAIERPIVGSSEALRSLELRDAGIATSGDYRNFFNDGGIRYSHTIDPRTGHPVQHELASVTVVASSCMEADAFSTAMMVLGPSEAIELAEDKQIAAQFVLKSVGLLEEVFSSSFEKIFVS